MGGWEWIEEVITVYPIQASRVPVSFVWRSALWDRKWAPTLRWQPYWIAFLLILSCFTRIVHLNTKYTNIHMRQRYSCNTRLGAHGCNTRLGVLQVTPQWKSQALTRNLMSNLRRMLHACVFNWRETSVLSEIWVTSSSIFSRGVSLRA